LGSEIELTLEKVGGVGEEKTSNIKKDEEDPPEARRDKEKNGTTLLEQTAR